MPLILSIETATDVCSVALSEGEDILSLREDLKGRSHASLLTTFIQDVMKGANVVLSDIDAVAVSKGPGSYTGLRIGVATCKGLCYALEKPLIAVGTLPAMVATRKLDHGEDKRLQIPMIDARRMEVYTAVYSSGMEPVRGVEALILDRTSFEGTDPEGLGMVMFGDGMPKAESLFNGQPGVEFDHEARPSARGVAYMASQCFDNQDFVDIAYFEPFYLKDFVGTVPRSGLKPSDNQ